MKKLLILPFLVVLCVLYGVSCAFYDVLAGKEVIRTSPTAHVMPTPPDTTQTPAPTPSPDNTPDNSQTPAPIFTGAVAQLSGTIQSIEYTAQNNVELTVENAGLIMVFVITSYTYTTYERSGMPIEQGIDVTLFYDARLSRTMQYPVRYEGIAIHIGAMSNTDEDSYKVDLFDHALLSSDALLKLRIGEDTVVFDMAEQPFYGELQGRFLAVNYDKSAIDIYGYTTPFYVTVLDYTEDYYR